MVLSQLQGGRVCTTGIAYDCLHIYVWLMSFVREEENIYEEARKEVNGEVAW